MYICVYMHVCLGIWFPGTGVTGSCEVLCRCRELSFGLLKDQSAFLTRVTSPAPAPWNIIMLIIPMVSVRVYISVIKHHTQEQLGGRKGLFHLTSCSPPCRESGAGTQGWNCLATQRPCLLTGLHSMACRVCFYIPSRTTSPGLALPIVRWNIPHPSSVTTGLPTGLWGHFF